MMVAQCGMVLWGWYALTCIRSARWSVFLSDCKDITDKANVVYVKDKLTFLHIYKATWHWASLNAQNMLHNGQHLEGSTMIIVQTSRRITYDPCSNIYKDHLWSLFKHQEGSPMIIVQTSIRITYDHCSNI